MSVRLKCYVASKSENVHNPGGERIGSVALVPVTSGSAENAQFYRWTPSGRLEFQSVNQRALDALPLGAEVYVDLSVIPAEAPPVNDQ